MYREAIETKIGSILPKLQKKYIIEKLLEILLITFTDAIKQLGQLKSVEK